MQPITQTTAVPGSFLANLTDAEWSELRALGLPRRFTTGQTLMSEGEAGNRVMLVTGGRVKVVRFTHDGKERFLSIRDRGDILGELAFLDSEPRISTVIALEPTDVLIVDGGAFGRFLQHTPRVAYALLVSLAHRFRETTIKRSQFGASDTVGRLAARVVELAERYGEADGDTIVIGIALTQEELGSWAVGSPAGTAKALQTMREFGWISTERRRIVVRDLQALRARAG